MACGGGGVSSTGTRLSMPVPDSGGLRDALYHPAVAERLIQQAAGLRQRVRRVGQPDVVAAGEVDRAYLARVRAQRLERIRDRGVIGCLGGLDRSLQHVDEVVVQSLDGREEDDSGNFPELLALSCLIA